MSTGRAFPFVTLLVMSALMPLSGITLRTEQVAPSAEAIDQPTLRDVQQEPMTATDGTAFVITRAIVSVPELRAAPGKPSGSIELAVVRARRADTAVASRGAHVVLAGGPGDSGVSLVLNTVQRGGAALGELFNGDIVGIDQRGTGKSSPNLSSAARYGLPLDPAGSPESWLPLMSSIAANVAADFRARGIRLEAYNTRESADDVDAVRRAFGYKAITLWGRSYGSHLALAVLRQHPGAVERLILVSPEGPDHTWKLPSHVDAVLRRLDERAPQLGLRTMMREVIGRLARTPAVVTLEHPVSKQPVTVTIGAFDVQWLTAQALADPRAIATLPAAYREMAAGDFRRIATLAVMFRMRLGVESAMKHMMDLSSGVTPARLARIEREAAEALLGDAINFPGRSLAEIWKPVDLGDEFRRPVISEVPALILAGDLDPRTPIENGHEIVATLSRGRLITIQNATHQFDVFGSAPVKAVLRQFLNGEAISTERITLPLRVE
jgi:pimeloyl-ACP methyl ester carboxylesterase